MCKSFRGGVAVHYAISYSRTPQHKWLDVKIWYGRFYILFVANINGFSETHNIPSVSPARVHRMPECLSSAPPNVFIIIIFHRAPSKTLLVIYCTAIWVGAIQRNIRNICNFRNTVFQWSYKRTLTVHLLSPSYASETDKFSFTSFSSVSWYKSEWKKNI